MIRRWAFSFASAFSLLVCIATLWVWVRTYRKTTVLSYYQHDRAFAALICHGEAEFYDYQMTTGGFTGWVLREQADANIINSDDGTQMMWWGTFGTPHGRILFWPVFAIGLLMPAGWVLTRVARTRTPRAGRCAACGYDLTANTSGICPECGTPVPSKSEVYA